MLTDTLAHVRRRAGTVAFDGFYTGLASLFSHHPDADPERLGIEVQRNVPYAPDGEESHLLDIYRPKGAKGPLPVVLYLHGGGFRILSKDSHFVMALAFARRGFLVFNANYRLAPRYRYPAAVEDAAQAYVFATKMASTYGGDPSTLVVAGESAGANLATSLTVMACYRREEPAAQQVFNTGIVPKALWAGCGLLQVTDTARFARKGGISAFALDRLAEVEEVYLGTEGAQPGTPFYDLCDPLCVLERGVLPERPLPACFASVGTADPILDDTRRLETAFRRLGATCEARYYPGEPHAFQALLFRKNARECWRHTFEFLARTLGRDLAPAAPLPSFSLHALMLGLALAPFQKLSDVPVLRWSKGSLHEIARRARG